MDVSRLVCAVCIAATILSTGCNPEQAVAFPLAFPLDGQPGTIAQATAASQPSSQKPSSPPLTQEERNRQLKNQQLIDNAEQAYRTGVDNYHAGHLEAAKASFDYAVDEMLSSGLDLKNDPQLSAEFEHLVDAINTLEMEALKQGNG